MSDQSKDQDLQSQPETDGQDVALYGTDAISIEEIIWYHTSLHRSGFVRDHLSSWCKICEDAVANNPRKFR